MPTPSEIKITIEVSLIISALDGHLTFDNSSLVSLRKVIGDVAIFKIRQSWRTCQILPENI